MKIAYATQYDPADVNRWSGLVQYISQSLQHQGLSVQHIGPLREKNAIFHKSKQLFYRHVRHQSYLRNRERSTLKSYAAQITQQLTGVAADIIFSPESLAIGYLQHQKPIVFWTDATFAGMVGFYHKFMNLCPESLAQGHAVEQQALDNCKLAIYSSEWAAQTAINHYRADPRKVKVVPFGANLAAPPSAEQVKSFIAARPSNHCNLLFLGVDWVRKGGDIALKVAIELNRQGLPTTLTVVGCDPQVSEPLPPFVKPLGFISKASPGGYQTINKLLAEAHFLILPSIADCTPMVFCEANAFGIPCLATHVGGIPSMITPNLNGNTFSRDARIAEYCTYIESLFAHYPQYQDLAWSSFNEYQSRLNWTVAGKMVKSLLQDVI